MLCDFPLNPHPPLAELNSQVAGFNRKSPKVHPNKTTILEWQHVHLQTRKINSDVHQKRLKDKNKCRFPPFPHENCRVHPCSCNFRAFFHIFHREKCHFSKRTVPQRFRLRRLCGPAQTFAGLKSWSSGRGESLKNIRICRWKI